MQPAIYKLKQLGFSEYEAKAYMALMHDNPLTAYELSKNSGIPSSKIYEVVRKLEFKHIIQSVHGERSKMFIPVPPDEFVHLFKSSVENNLYAVRDELKTIKYETATRYTWHIKDYESVIHRAQRMISTARKSILLLIWKEEMDLLIEAVNAAVERGIKIAIIHYGVTEVKIAQLYMHPVSETIYADKACRGFTLVADAHEALNGTIDGKKAEAVWSMSKGFVIMAEDYIRHDIYQMKIMSRFAPIVKKKFGDSYEKLLDVFTDEAY